MLDYPCADCAKFGDFSFSRFGIIVRTEDRITHTQTTDAAKRLTHATVVSVSNEKQRQR